MTAHTSMCVSQAVDAVSDWIGYQTNETAAVAGCTPLMAALGSDAAGRMEDTVAAAVRTLLKYGANVSALDRNGKTPLHYAVHPRGADLMNTKLQHSARRNALSVLLYV